ncbi:MAG: PAS domain S-box protein [Cyanobacteria bacterium P01_A01_bin.84]
MYANYKVRQVPIASNLEGNKQADIQEFKGNAESQQVESLLGSELGNSLPNNQKLYKFLVEDSTDIISVQTPENIYTYVSPASLHMLGYEPEYLIGKSIYEFFHFQDKTALEATQRAIGKFPKYYTHTYRVRHRDGHYIWLETRNQTIYDSDGETALEILSISQDITERKNNEALVIQLNDDLEKRVEQRTTQLEATLFQKDKLVKSEQEAKGQIEVYRDIVENIPLGFCIWHLENINDITSLRLVNVNKTASSVLGLPLENEIGKRMIECFPHMLEGNNLKMLAAYAEIARSGKTRFFDEVHYSDNRLKGGFFSVKAFALKNNCVVIAFEDITKRKQTEIALSESEFLYRSVVNSVKEVIFQTDTSGNLMFLNNAWEELTGFTIEESLHKSFSDFLYAEEDKKLNNKLFQSLMSTKQEAYQFEFRIQRKDGDFRWFQSSSQPQINASGNLIGSLGTLNDITKRKQTEAILKARAEETVLANTMLLQATAQLEKRNTELDRFTYVVSHDLKAPLRAINNLSQWIEEDLEELLTEDTRHQMNLLRGRVKRMEDFINGLLEYSRVGRAETKTETVAVGEMLSEIIDLTPFPSEFTIETQGDMPTLTTEKVLLQQVFSNLISNAVKHHHRSDGKVTVSVEEKDKFYNFTIADDGPGIAPEYHGKIFNIFQTLEARDKTENTGIGLAIVKKIIEEQGGSITVDSTVGRGTTFYFSWNKSDS